MSAIFLRSLRVCFYCCEAWRAEIMIYLSDRQIDDLLKLYYN